MEIQNLGTGEIAPPVPPFPNEPAALDIIRTETVLSRLPVHNLAKKGRVDIRILKTTPNGAVELKWEVSYNERYGQARQLAYKLDTIIINRRIDDVGKPLPEMIRIGSLNEICGELGSQKNELKRALQQNATTAINAKLMYKGNDGTERQLEALFTRYSVIFTGEKLPGGKKADAIYIVFNKPYREVLDNAPVRPLDREYMKELPPAAQRFYEIVSYKIFSALKNNHPYAKLAYSEYCTFSAQHRSIDWEFVRSQMYQVHQPHVKSGYLVKPIRHDKTTDGEGNLDWIFYYTPGPKARAEFAAAHRGQKIKTVDAESIRAGESPHPKHTRAVSSQRKIKLPPPPAQLAVTLELIHELSKRGVSESSARKELATLPADFPVIDTLEYGDFQIDHSHGRIENPAGFYVSLLREKAIPPSTFETSAKRKAREEEERRRQEEHDAEQERLAAEEEADEQMLDDLQAKDPERYQALYRQCEETLYREFPNLGRFGKPDSSLHFGSIRGRLKRLLKDQPAPEQGTLPSFLLKPVAELAVADTLPAIVPEADPQNFLNPEIGTTAPIEEPVAEASAEEDGGSQIQPEPQAVIEEPPTLEPAPEPEPAPAIAATATEPAPAEPQRAEQASGSIESHLL